MKSRLTETDIQTFFRFLYFGKYTDVISVSIDKAYLDFNRTLHGLDAYKKKNNNKDCVTDAKKVLTESIHELLEPKTKIQNQQAFDDGIRKPVIDCGKNSTIFRFSMGRHKNGSTWRSSTFSYWSRTKSTLSIHFFTFPSTIS